MNDIILKRGFASDNNSGVHPAVIEELVRVNRGHVVGYGDDPSHATLASSVGRLLASTNVPLILSPVDFILARRIHVSHCTTIQYDCIALSSRYILALILPGADDHLGLDLAMVGCIDDCFLDRVHIVLFVRLAPVVVLNKERVPLPPDDHTARKRRDYPYVGDRA